QPARPQLLALDLANRLLQRQPFAGDVGFAERRGDAAQLRHQRPARALIQGAAGLARVVLETVDGSGNERMVVGHRFPVSAAPRFALTPRTDFGPESCPRAPDSWIVAPPDSRSI